MCSVLREIFCFRKTYEKQMRNCHNVVVRENSEKKMYVPLLLKNFIYHYKYKITV